MSHSSSKSYEQDSHRVLLKWGAWSVMQLRKYNWILLLLALVSTIGCSGKNFLDIELDDVMIHDDVVSLVLRISSGINKTAWGSDYSRIEVNRRTLIFVQYSLSGTSPVTPILQKTIDDLAVSDDVHIQIVDGGFLETSRKIMENDWKIIFIETNTARRIDVGRSLSPTAPSGTPPWLLNRSRNKCVLTESDQDVSIVDFPSLKRIPNVKLAQLLAPTTGKCQLTDDLRTVISEADSEEVVTCHSVTGTEQKLRLSPGGFFADAERIDNELFLIEKHIAKGFTQVAGSNGQFVRHFPSMERFVWDCSEGKLFFIPFQAREGKIANFVLIEWNYKADNSRTFKLVPPSLWLSKIHVNSSPAGNIRAYPH